MKILSWNIMQGGGNRIDRILAVINGHGVDAVALSEVSPGRTGQLCGGLTELGFVHCHAPPIPSGQRGVLVASKVQFEAHPPRNDFRDDKTSDHSSMLISLH
jgi:exonuclease III